MTVNSRDNRDVFWTLALLMTDFGVDLTPREVRRFAPFGTVLPLRTRVGLTARAGYPSARATAAAQELIRSGMRPVVPLDLTDPADHRHLHRALAAWEQRGVGDVVFNVGPAPDIAAVLDGIVELISGPLLRRAGFFSVGLRVGAVEDDAAGAPVVESADLLRALDAAHDTARDLGVELYLTTPPARNVRRLLRWERSLRAAGNRLPIRAGLRGLPGPDLLPTWRTALPKDDPRRLVLGLATAVAQDPDSNVQSVQLFPGRTVVPTVHWARALGAGNFLIEDDPEHGHRVTTLN